MHALQCPISEESHHVSAMANTYFQLDEDGRKYVASCVPPDELKTCKGRYLFVGAVQEWNRTTNFDRSARRGWSVAVEVLWYYAVRNF